MLQTVFARGQWQPRLFTKVSLQSFTSTQALGYAIPTLSKAHKELEDEKVYITRTVQKGLEAKKLTIARTLPHRIVSFLTFGALSRTKKQMRSVSAEFMYNCIQDHVLNNRLAFQKGF
jgi:hypothetical protein